MRPQHNTAEDYRNRNGLRPPLKASMRPQHNTAEDRASSNEGTLTMAASMRPQHNTAEDGGVYTDTPFLPMLQ